MMMEQTLLTGEPNTKILNKYCELTDSVALQLQMFRASFEIECLADAQHVFQNMVPEVRNLFPAVEQLIRLMLICPVSSCSAKRSFSALRRLKTCLRSSMTEKRLNSVVVCHVNKHTHDNLELKLMAAEFSQRSEIRMRPFGNAALFKL